MTVQEIIDEIRWKTRTTTATLADADIIKGLQNHYGQIIMEILKVRTDYNFSVDEATTDFNSIIGLAEGDDGYNGEYSFPSLLVRPLRAEISYDGDVYVPCKVYDLNDNISSEYQEEALKAEFSKQQPYIRFEGDVFTIRPLKEDAGNITKGIRVWYESRKAELTEVTDVPKFEEYFHEILSYMGALRYAERYPKKHNEKWETKRQELLAALRESYKNQFKRNFKIKAKKENYK